MSLGHAILGFLNWRPMTGYDLKTQCFDHSVSYFWAADQAQIYRTLEKMETEGWVESKIEVQHERPNRKVYAITEKGRSELRQWLRSLQPLPNHREPHLVQLYFGSMLSNEEAVQQLDHQKDLHQEQLEEYEGIRASFAPEEQRTREEVFAFLTLRVGIEMEKMYMRVIEENIETIRKLRDVEK